ncbi:hypothetical protein HELRODRAFT_186232 [Helobdella robusta]|uniref:Hflx-type G domain-containing protein n=1 Tax=Helobdella robusta TaxID=6412 RepID=T1FNU6_HELRO|nr:hypothetical protein HELRODRAFT_186232 [Helobdella robusta]ESN90009.1 hypothetical protein HELRODRAFT_186232 [Helobdella robusta]
MMKLVRKNIFKNYLSFCVCRSKILATSTRHFQDCADEDESLEELFPRLSKIRHSVFIIQPNMRDVPEKAKNTSANHQLSELCSLVHSIPDWLVIDKAIHSLKFLDKQHVFGKGKLEELRQHVKSSSLHITAIVMGMPSLNTNQLSNLQHLFNLPVYDRYTLVLEIFRARASTNEAKLQVSMAEINYIRYHLHGLHRGTLDFQTDALELVGGTSEVPVQTRKMLLRDRESKIQKELVKLEKQRTLAMEKRRKMKIPSVAVVGYTNAGKTSLIKSLTKNENMAPKNQLFATLDISNFQGFLPNRMKVLYVDTIGFISDLHPSLLNAFSSTLQDIAYADLLVHVCDVSHPDRRLQDEVVRRTITNLPLMPDELLRSVVRVYNKVDLLGDSERAKLEEETLTSSSSSSSSPPVLISVKNGWNRDEVMMTIQNAIIKATGRVTKKLKIPINSGLLQWLYKESEVEEVTSDPKNAEMYLIKTTMTAQSYAKFIKNFKLKDKNSLS